MMFWIDLSDGSVRRIKAKNRKDAIRIAKSTGYSVYKITKDGGTLTYHTLSTAVGMPMLA